MLTVNPQKRISLNEIISSKWLNSEKNDQTEFSYSNKEFTYLINKIENMLVKLFLAKILIFRYFYLKINRRKYSK